MLKKFLLLFLLLLKVASFSKDIYSLEAISDSYNNLNLKNKISFTAFSNALDGLNQISTKKNILTIVDFTKPSTEERMFVIDLDNNKVLLSTHVSHGKGSGDLYAQSFSNKDGSYKSSPGFFLTGNIYDGINGESLELHGLEKGINDNARKRNIVIHGANYANPKFIVGNGRLGRSKGCLAVPFSINKNLINTIVGGTVFYVHINDYEIKEKEINLSLN
ncbi:murein L,D-transpeptidase catalytic domain family protein [Fusobacterium gastrosuis]|uniref:murein L,D-transpeptidase catalytic domain family protein n=1 Tax=Fusobacterium gastrosuis TaxID=1755100 RepID=UPI001F5003F9|nr:murein L,D-transpeptidase catalytic domain family protein [Fusobacterium gastrosuis]MDD7392691.1 murein L,D-transpeptidase catalytic domain family protein [Fusobacteriaceae bacterium]MDD7411199.1 murein L,D-transpeptidase catalytic domain family protein [Fusobacteriaceae bacterium]MDY5713498.1 murein L,D-transpeptidase catalytic domain family protein [Fusobacterium gastrosuis]MDY5794232.1 murein L,D-transpeptidase catalytic domain family protein [Fusobacterium gastrosuis]